MVGGRMLRELISNTKRTAKNIRASLDEIAQELLQQGGHHQQQPALARVPVRNHHHHHHSKTPFGSISHGRRDFSILTRPQQIRFASTFTSATRPTATATATTSNFFYKFHRFGKFGANFNYYLRPFKQLSTINGTTISRGIFPSSLYANFVRTNSNLHSQYTNYTKECVKNLRHSIRAFSMQTKDAQRKIQHQQHQRGYGVAFNAKLSNEVFQMAKTESSFGPGPVRQVHGMASTSAFVDFKMNSFDTKMPSMSFMDDEIIQELQIDFENHQQNLIDTLRQIHSIKSEFGSLPISLHDNNNTVRIHFPNCDAEKVEVLLREIGVTKGVVHEVTSTSTTVGTVGAEGSATVTSNIGSDTGSSAILSSSSSSSSSPHSSYFSFDDVLAASPSEAQAKSNTNTISDILTSSSDEYTNPMITSSIRQYHTIDDANFIMS